MREDLTSVPRIWYNHLRDKGGREWMTMKLI